MTMLEKIQRALDDAMDMAIYRGGPTGTVCVDGECDLETMARAALQAMLEPSEGMLSEGGGIEAPDGCMFVSDDVAGNVFRAMIQAALDGQ